jgi:SAM-dependent methyltransferase
MDDDDRWLDRWLPLLAERAQGRPLLELGCGTGRDTAALQRAGHRVVALDRSRASLVLARIAAPAARLVRQDVREPWPPCEDGYGAVIASLSLHYFDWATTEGLIARVRDALGAGGVFICRLNSTRDHYFGARGHPLIEPNFFNVNGEPKRFFARADVDRLFARGWRTVSAEESVIDRYLAPKAAWELVLETAFT